MKFHNWPNDESLIVIEMKANLTKAECQRLRGQIREYAPKWQALLMVLCGETAPNYVADVEKTLTEKEPTVSGFPMLVQRNRLFLKL